MKKVFLQAVDVKENRIDPVPPSEANNYMQVLGTQSFSVEINFVTSGTPISVDDFHTFVFEKIGRLGASFEIKQN